MTKHRKNRPAGNQTAQGGVELVKKTPAPVQTKAKAKAKSQPQEKKAPNFIQRFISFLKDARRELTRVTWPTRKETIHSTGVLLVLVCIAALYLFIVDNIINLAVVDGLRELLLKIVVKLKL
ncbi:MAG: preprotein translocase subunit SecE [Deltaproteobacteria bacterium]|jgi:preprotein translocase subunit SecE|nr:preprotein translocase subunit SecE [Deltaproteobacteria bacterium]